MPYHTLLCPTLPYPTLHYTTLHYMVHNTTLRHPTLPYLALPCPYSTLIYLTLPYSALPYSTLPFLVTLDSICDQDDEYFPQYRAFDWFSGHSWARGLLYAGDGKDQVNKTHLDDLDRDLWYPYRGMLCLWAFVLGIDPGGRERLLRHYPDDVNRVMNPDLDCDLS